MKKRFNIEIGVIIKYPENLSLWQVSKTDIKCYFVMQIANY